MPAGLPGASLAQNQANPSQGRTITFDALSGPKGSPFDAKKPNYISGGAFVNDPDNVSTGALSSGIGYDKEVIKGIVAQIAPDFQDDLIVGNRPSGVSGTPAIGVMRYIGGGRSTLSGNPGNQVVATAPYTAGTNILGAGNGGSRDAGAGPAFTGFEIKMVTATGSTANAAVIETGWVNRSGVTLLTGQSTFGSAVAASAAPA
jgi:hypothetical protein